MGLCPLSRMALQFSTPPYALSPNRLPEPAGIIFDHLSSTVSVGFFRSEHSGTYLAMRRVYRVQLEKAFHTDLTILDIVPVFVLGYAKPTKVNDLGVIDCFISYHQCDDLPLYLSLNLRHSKLIL